jgi:hypothetical protein
MFYLLAITVETEDGQNDEGYPSKYLKGVLGSIPQGDKLFIPIIILSILE